MGPLKRAKITPISLPGFWPLKNPPELVLIRKVAPCSVGGASSPDRGWKPLLQNGVSGWTRVHLGENSWGVGGHDRAVPTRTMFEAPRESVGWARLFVPTGTEQGLTPMCTGTTTRFPQGALLCGAGFPACLLAASAWQAGKPAPHGLEFHQSTVVVLGSA